MIPMLPAPHPAAGMRRLARPTLALAIAAVAGCGMRNDAPPAAAAAPALQATSAPDVRAFVARLAEGRPTKRIMTVAPGVDADALMDWAQHKYPQFFPKGAATIDVEYQGVAYQARIYPGPNYLGVTRQGEVWGLGSFTHGQLMNFGPVAAYAAMVQADRCAVYAERCAAPSALDTQVRALIARHGLTGDPTVGRTLPHIADALPQLGKLLFFSKSLSAQRDTACASCHHPSLGGGDRLGVSVGAGAAQSDLLGLGRQRPDGALLVARNANTILNVALYDRVLFADGRVESLAPTATHGGAGTPIRTPDSSGANADPNAGPNLLAAQARFPITGASEMRGHGFPGVADAEVRRLIAARLAEEAAAAPAGSGWLPHFRRAFGRPQGSAQELVTFDNIMVAIAEYQRSAIFVRSPWQRYVLGENAAIGDDAKRGAIKFFTTFAEGGTQCVQCHKGDFFTDEKFHPIGFPQAGPGFDAQKNDFGRQRVSGRDTDGMAFRTPGLLNVTHTGPYGHAGAYSGLSQAIQHYGNTSDLIALFLASRGWCTVAGYAQNPGCRDEFADVSRLSQMSLGFLESKRLEDPANAMPVLNAAAFNNGPGVDWIEKFLAALGDPCLDSRACLARWIPRPDEAPDAHQLNAVDELGRPL